MSAARRGTLDAEKHDAVLLRASRTVQRVGQLVDGLLLLARAGRTPPPGASANAGDVVKDVIATLAPVASDRDVKVEAERLDSSTVACSPGVLTSVVSNLLDNALKHMGEAPVRQVRVRTTAGGKVTRIEVEDSGPGLTDDMRARIFEPYFRGTTTDSSGLGLGLAMVRRMVEAHGGEVGVDAGRIGSLFWVELPTISAGGSAPRA